MKTRIHQKVAKCSGNPVAQCLALTPYQMLEMTNKGIAVTPQNVNANAFFDGEQNPSFDLPLDSRRGVDINDMWEAKKDFNASAKSLHKHLNDLQNALKTD